MPSMANSSGSGSGHSNSMNNLRSSLADYAMDESSSSNSSSWPPLEQHFDNVTIQSQAEHWLQTGAVHMLATHGATMPTTLTSPSDIASTTMSSYKQSLRDGTHEHSAQSRVVAADHDQHHDMDGTGQQQIFDQGHHHRQHDGSVRGLVRDGELQGVYVADGHYMPTIFHARVEEVILFEFWHTRHVWHMLLSCLMVILLGIVYEGIKFYREWLFKQRASRSNSKNSNKANAKKPTIQWHDRSAGGGGNQLTAMFDAFNTNRRTIGGALPPQPSEQSQQSGQSQQSQRTQQSAQSQRSMQPQTSQQSSSTAQQQRWLQSAPSAGRDGDVDRALAPRRETNICSRLHFVQTFLHLLQVALGFMLMLIFMTFNVWLCTAVVLGAGIGYFLFFWRLQRINLEHCI